MNCKPSLSITLNFVFSTDHLDALLRYLKEQSLSHQKFVWVLNISRNGYKKLSSSRWMMMLIEILPPFDSFLHVLWLILYCFLSLIRNRPQTKRDSKVLVSETFYRCVCHSRLPLKCMNPKEQLCPCLDSSLIHMVIEQAPVLNLMFNGVIFYLHVNVPYGDHLDLNFAGNHLDNSSKTLIKIFSWSRQCNWSLYVIIVTSSRVREVISSGYQKKPEKRVENTKRSGVFLTNFEVFG